MERSTPIPDAEYLQAITDFSVEFVANTSPIFWPSIARRIGLVLGFGVELTPDEEAAVSAGIEAGFKSKLHKASEEIG